MKSTGIKDGIKKIKKQIKKMDEVLIQHGERIRELEVLTNGQQKQLDEHEMKIKTLENINHVVEKLSDTVTLQGETMTKNVKELTEIISDLKKATEDMQDKQKEMEIKQQYLIIDSVISFFKKLGWKGFVGWLATIGAAVTAILKFM